MNGPRLVSGLDGGSWMQQLGSSRIAARTRCALRRSLPERE